MARKCYTSQVEGRRRSKILREFFTILQAKPSVRPVPLPFPYISEKGYQTTFLDTLDRDENSRVGF